jgi:hypothetical protein
LQLSITPNKLLLPPLPPPGAQRDQYTRQRRAALRALLFGYILRSSAGPTHSPPGLKLLHFDHAGRERYYRRHSWGLGDWGVARVLSCQCLEGWDELFRVFSKARSYIDSSGFVERHNASGQRHHSSYCNSCFQWHVPFPSPVCITGLIRIV